MTKSHRSAFRASWVSKSPFSGVPFSDVLYTHRPYVGVEMQPMHNTYTIDDRIELYEDNAGQLYYHRTRDGLTLYGHALDDAQWQENADDLRAGNEDYWSLDRVDAVPDHAQLVAWSDADGHYGSDDAAMGSAARYHVYGREA